jgi:hypothetical protein
MPPNRFAKDRQSLEGLPVNRQQEVTLLQARFERFRL